MKGIKLDNCIIREISKRKTLKSLDLASCIAKKGTLFELNLPNLLIFKLPDIPNIDKCLMNITNESKNLEHLEYKWSGSASAAALKKLSTLKNLVHLDLQMVVGFNNGAITAIINGCKKLEKLYLSTWRFPENISLTNLENLRDIGKANSTSLVCLSSLS